jgi:DNA-binding transcriptional ArsR family regulator
MSVVPAHVLDEAARRFFLLSDATRLRIVNALLDAGEATVAELAEATGTSLANASQHLARLRDGGIVRRRRVGRTTRYWVSDPTIEGLCRIVCSSVRERARVLSA